MKMLVVVVLMFLFAIPASTVETKSLSPIIDPLIKAEVPDVAAIPVFVVEGRHELVFSKEGMSSDGGFLTIIYYREKERPLMVGEKEIFPYMEVVKTDQFIYFIMVSIFNEETGGFDHYADRAAFSGPAKGKFERVSVGELPALSF